MTHAPGTQRWAVTSAPAPSGLLASPVVLRVALAAGCLVAIALAVRAGDPAPLLAQDPDLARLLRGMACIKGAMVLAGVSVLAWRFGAPIDPRLAVLFLVCAWIAAGAATFIWQLSFIGPAALAFHTGELAGLFAAWREHRASRA